MDFCRSLSLGPHMIAGLFFLAIAFASWLRAPGCDYGIDPASPAP
jgi:hypothetical protein